jgi:hypothetical protein
LLSTMLPSIFNLSVAIFSFLRGITPVRRLILDRITGRSAETSDRVIAASLLTGQIFGGLALTVAVFWLFVFELVPFALPYFGKMLFSLAEMLAAANYPSRILSQ